MEISDLKSRVAELLVEELKEGNRRWFYISMADKDTFFGGIFVQAFGPTDAWCLMHSLNVTPPRPAKYETMTMEVPEDKVHLIPDNKKWRKLNREEATSIG